MCMYVCMKLTYYGKSSVGCGLRLLACDRSGARRWYGVVYGNPT